MGSSLWKTTLARVALATTAVAAVLIGWAVAPAAAAAANAYSPPGGSSLPAARVGQPYSTSITVTSQTDYPMDYVWTDHGGLPAGLTWHSSGSSSSIPTTSTITISGTPTGASKSYTPVFYVSYCSFYDGSTKTCQDTGQDIESWRIQVSGSQSSTTAPPQTTVPPAPPTTRASVSTPQTTSAPTGPTTTATPPSSTASTDAASGPTTSVSTSTSAVTRTSTTPSRSATSQSGVAAAPVAAPVATHSGGSSGATAVGVVAISLAATVGLGVGVLRRRRPVLMRAPGECAELRERCAQTRADADAARVEAARLADDARIEANLLSERAADLQRAELSLSQTGGSDAAKADLERCQRMFDLQSRDAAGKAAEARAAEERADLLAKQAEEICEDAANCVETVLNPPTSEVPKATLDHLQKHALNEPPLVVVGGTGVIKEPPIAPVKSGEASAQGEVGVELDLEDFMDRCFKRAGSTEAPHDAPPSVVPKAAPAPPKVIDGFRSIVDDVLAPDKSCVVPVPYHWVDHVVKWAEPTMAATPDVKVGASATLVDAIKALPSTGGSASKSAMYLLCDDVTGESTNAPTGTIEILSYKFGPTSPAGDTAFALAKPQIVVLTDPPPEPAITINFDKLITQYQEQAETKGDAAMFKWDLRHLKVDEAPTQPSPSWIGGIVDTVKGTLTAIIIILH